MESIRRIDGALNWSSNPLITWTVEFKANLDINEEAWGKFLGEKGPTLQEKRREFWRTSKWKGLIDSTEKGKRVTG